MLLVISIGGVYAEDNDGASSVVTESPISADVDTSLSSCDAFNNDLSNIYEPSDSINLYESFDSYHGFSNPANLFESSDLYNFYESSELAQINEKIGCAYDNSYDYCEGDIAVIDVGYNYMDLLGSVDVPVINVGCEYVDSNNYHGSIENMADMEVNYEDVDYGTLKMPVIYENGEINPTFETVDGNVIINNFNSYSKFILENINIPVSLPINSNRHDGVDEDASDTIISEVTLDMETSESYKLIRDVTQADNLLNFENADAVLAINVTGVLSSEASEPVFDGFSRASEYISDVEEVYVGTLSQEDNEKLLETIGSENTLLFASIANWYSGVTFDMLQEQANHGQIREDILDVYNVTKALLQYYPLTNELYIYKLSNNNEDEHSHVINDTNSHGLDYAYAKHVKVVYKDMPNLMVLTSFGVVFIEEQLSTGSWDSLNDVLGMGISSETLLPDHKAIWTPLLLLTQQNLQEFVNSHADDNKNKNKFNATIKTDDNKGQSNSSNVTPWPGKHFYVEHFPVKHFQPSHMSHNCDYSDYYCYAADDVQSDNISLNLSDISSNSKLDNVTKNSTDNKTNSSNVTTTTNGKRKTIQSPPKTNGEAEPTYTLVYAIIGIAFVSILFNSSYMKRDD